MEVNPITRNQRILDYYKASVNRLSFGFQSFQNDVLNILGSHHQSRDCYRVVDAARKAGFQNIGIDLMFRLPGQSLKDWEVELKKTIDLDLEHVSCYSMILDPASPLAREIEEGTKPQQPNENDDIDMSKFTLSFMRSNGYNHYASCASCGHDFAKPDGECRYEKMHWGAPQVDYLGIGPGAYGFVNGRIYCNHHNLENYNQTLSNGSIPVVAGKILTEADRMSRFMVLGIKCISVSKQDFSKTFGVDVHSIFGKKIEQLKEWKLIIESDEDIHLTDLGRLYVDNVSKCFYSCENYLVQQPLESELRLQ